MTISWVNSEGQTGIAENAYDFAMQHSEQGKSSRVELTPQERINQAFGEGPTSELKDQNAPYRWGMGEDLKGLGTLPDASDAEWEKAYGTKDFHQQLASFQQRLDATPPEEAGALRKFLGSLNIMPAPNKPQEEWSAKEHLGVILNQAMAGMGAGWRGAGTIAPRNFKAAFNKIEPPANANEPGGVPGISRQINPTAAEEAALMDSWNNMVKESRKADLKVIEGGKGLTTETIPQLQQAQHRGPSEPVPPKTMTTPAIEQLAKYEELSSQGKTTKQIVKGTKLDPEQVREALGRDNLAIAAFNSENALTNSYFKSLENLDPALGEALKKQVSVKDLKRYTRGLPEERLKTIFEELPSHVKEAFESGEQRRLNIDASKKSKIIPKSTDEPNTNRPTTEGEVKAGWDTNRKTPVEIDSENFLAKNKLPAHTEESRIALVKSRIKQIEYDRRIRGRPAGEDYPSDPELLQLRTRLKNLTK